VLGGLYLAYDLLGGQHGPLRLLTRIVTYSIVFGIGYGLGLGLFFGVVSGAATGITIAIELHRMGSRNNHYSLPWQALFSAIRGVAFGAGLYRTLDFSYAATFAALITMGGGSWPGSDLGPAASGSAAFRCAIFGLKVGGLPEPAVA